MENFDLKSVKLTDGFWADRQEKNRTVTMDAVYDTFYKTGRFEALKCQKKEEKTHIFWDSDVAKWLEAAAYLVYRTGDADIRKKYDAAVDDIVKSQRPDGYFNSYFQVYEPENIFTKRSEHELYCAGHLFEAAVAAKKYLSDDRLLGFSERYVDYITERFVEKKDTGFTSPGHEEIELALFRLFLLTGKEKYRRLGNWFIEARGVNENEKRYDAEYHQSHEPCKKQREATGHAVRALYLYCGMADYAALNGDGEMREAVEKLYRDVVYKKMYVTGGVGSNHDGERIMHAYDLPNLNAYAETCASVALALLSDRMMRLTGEAFYGDILERTIYNGVISGISLNGKEFFYVNPISADKEVVNRYKDTEDAYRFNLPLLKRIEYFYCSCCPPNLNRFFEEVPSFIAYFGEGEVTVSQYISSKIKGEGFEAEIRSGFPYDGKVEISVHAEKPTRLKLRVPAWSDLPNENGYIVKTVSGEQTISLDFGMRPRAVYAHPGVEADAGRLAVTYGPLVLCAESADNAFDVKKTAISPAAVEKAVISRDNFCGFSLTLPATVRKSVEKRAGYEALYSFAPPPTEEKKLVLIPYFAWANREEGDMRVWLLQS